MVATNISAASEMTEQLMWLEWQAAMVSCRSPGSTVLSDDRTSRISRLP